MIRIARLNASRLIRSGPFRRRANIVLSIVVSVAMMGLLAAGAGAIPPLGSALDPGAGVWDSAADGRPVKTETIRLDGMHAAATVSFDTAGVPTMHAGSEEDLFLVEGYVQARFRLSQMDLERRTAEGRLAELAGSPAVDSDTFELQTGLLRTAQANWSATPPDSEQGKALTAFSQGVNDRLAEVRRDGDWPTIFALTGVHPRDWTPVDSLAVQGVLTQVLSYTTLPLKLDKLNSSLGPELTKAWFPVQSPTAQRPYDTGPYQNLGIAPLPADADAAATPTSASSGSAGSPASPASPASTSAASIDGLLAQYARLSDDSQIHSYPDSNAWAANGPEVADGRAMLAGDPHLQLSLPSYWFQVALSAPSMTVSGASLVGLPGVVIGRNAAISWSMTAVQNQSTYFYSEKTSPDHPGQYFWQGAWRDMQRVHYTIPVRGASTVSLDVDLTVHGPVLSHDNGQTISVNWTGDYPSQSLAAMLAVDKAQSWNQFHEALRGWHAPTLNFAYADGQGDIGIVAAGYFPLVKTGQPWLPLPGTGEDDVAGAIPYDAQPQVYDPPDHVVVSTNQRPVSADYPYYIGTSFYFDYGYRTAQIHSNLDGRSNLTAADFTAQQTDVTDYLSTLIVPKLAAALKDAPLDARQRQAFQALTSWDHQMTTPSVGASVWSTFWKDYLSAVFQPWWDAKKVPTGDDGAPEVGTDVPSLMEDLQAWTLGDQDNPAFSPPGRTGTATTVMRTAFAQAVTDLRKQLGGDPKTWTWGRLHTREIPALSKAPGLGYGPFPAGGDGWTVDAADGGMNSAFGPSWRMVVDWTGPQQATAAAIYPGGQSENPLSPWYQNLVSDWWNGRLRPMPWPDDPAPRSGVVWTLRAGG
ncbi:penicillin amidase [Catenulispora sp. GP43]|uniref:penicillin acylase family protein n=1 Tax=Catenulispora sp. GP43 TaxID=3156263 RepID=UPI003511BCDC